MNGQLSDEILENPLRRIQTRYDWRYVAVEEGVELLVQDWTPHDWDEQQGETVLFLPGFASRIDGWRSVLEALARNKRLIYLETREKASSKMCRRFIHHKLLSLSRIGEDIIAVVKKMGIDEKRLVLMGSSYGASAIIEALKGDRLKAKAAFLIGPNAEFRAAKYLHILLYLPTFLYHILKYFIIWYLKHFRVDTKNEPEQMQRYQRTLLEADPDKIQQAMRAAKNYCGWTDLETIQTPVAIAYAPTDTLHGSENIQKMLEILPNGFEVACESNKIMHDEPIARKLENYLKHL